jgi:ABC-type transport system involved in Fe-S cluster assembly fused permease/ATPase subunit
VLESVSRLTQGRTVLVIAHRREPVADADVVVALRAGRVVGDHYRLEPSEAPDGRVVPVAFEGRP